MEKFGRDSFGDPDAVSLYGMRPAEWYGRGIRVLGRTAVEAARDPLAKRIGAAVAAVAARAPSELGLGVLDPFAGSGNALFWTVRSLPRAEGIGFEFDPQVFDLTNRNLALLNAPIRLEHGDCRSLLGELNLGGVGRLVVVLAPPWADALHERSGLDLSRTKPPIAEIVEDFERLHGDRPILYVVETHERLAPEPVARLREKFDWSRLEIFDVGGPTGRHGVLLGGNRWGKTPLASYCTTTTGVPMWTRL